MDNQLSRNTNLDFVRGVSALLVLGHHLKNFQFNDLSNNPNLFDRVFNFFTGLGTEAVMIFFVLSGFLVGGSVIECIQRDRWSWADYTRNRLTRLWIVLIPALFLTLFWDSFNELKNGHEIFIGRFHSFFEYDQSQDRYSASLKTFLGNIFFLYPTFCSTYGTNVPLWSLNYEFWYYILFPVFCLSLFNNKNKKNRIFYAGTIITLLLFLPKNIIHRGIVWLMGVLVYWGMKNKFFVQLTGNFIFFSFALSSFFAILVIGHLELLKGTIGKIFQPELYTQYGLIGITFAGTLPFLSTHQLNDYWYKKTAHWLSEISYTLYLTHFPLLTFIFFTFMSPAISQPSLRNYLNFFALIALVLIYSLTLWYLFERRTFEVREYLNRKINRWSLW